MLREREKKTSFIRENFEKVESEKGPDFYVRHLFVRYLLDTNLGNITIRSGHDMGSNDVRFVVLYFFVLKVRIETEVASQFIKMCLMGLKRYLTTGCE